MNMNINNSGGSNPTKKRKGNEGNAIIATDSFSGGFLSSWFGYFSGRDAAPTSKCNDVNNINTSSQLDRMEQMMMRMEDKQKMLEEKCVSLENTLETKLQSLQDQVDRLEGNVNSSRVDAQQNYEYSQMLLRNQGWKYSAHVLTYDDWISKGYEDDVAEYLEVTASLLKNMTIDMRRGIFPNCTPSYKGICLHPDADAVNAGINDELDAHWNEFAAAIRQFTPAIKMVPDNFDRYFGMGGIMTNQNNMTMIREALIEKPFTHMCFDHHTDVEYDHGGMNIDSIIRVAESNKSLRKLEICNNSIDSDDMERLCSIVLNHPLMELNLDYSIDDDDVGDAMLTSLLSGQELKLEKLSMQCTSITSEISMVLANFIATNSKLKELNLEDNELNDNDATLIANALRSNTTLRSLRLRGNDFTRGCVDAFKPVVYDNRSLNAIASSNHTCCVDFYHGDIISLDLINTSENIDDNRGQKIYSLLSERHVEDNLSNVQYFSDIDVKLLPNMLEAIQKYGEMWAARDILWHDFSPYISCVSIVYEVMRKWEKVFNLYESV